MNANANKTANGEIDIEDRDRCVDMKQRKSKNKQIISYPGIKQSFSRIHRN